jgi:PPM family protein phosphatase
VVQSTFLRDSQIVREQAARVIQAKQRANPLLGLRSGVRTHVGLKRSENQDAFGFAETAKFCFYAVADGMGGHPGGARAADLAVEHVLTYLVEQKHVGLEDVREAVSRANERIFNEGRRIISRSGMGTTFCGILFSGTKLAVVNVGDSRAYRLREGILTCLTQDHTLAAELVTVLQHTSQNVLQDRSSMAHILTRALGHSASVEVDGWWCAESPQRGDVYLVSSDGLHGVLSEAEITSILQTHELKNAIEILVRCVNERGAPDNVTVLAIEVGKEFPIIGDEEESDSSDSRDPRCSVVHSQLSVHDSQPDIGSFQVSPPHDLRVTSQYRAGIDRVKYRRYELNQKKTEQPHSDSSKAEGSRRKVRNSFLLRVAATFLLGLLFGMVALHAYHYPVMTRLFSLAIDVLR